MRDINRRPNDCETILWDIRDAPTITFPLQEPEKCASHCVGFLDLPPEIRVDIYKLVFGCPRVVLQLHMPSHQESYRVRASRRIRRRPDLNAVVLFQTCKIISCEAQDVLYRQAEFAVETILSCFGCTSYDGRIVPDPSETIWLQTLERLQKISVQLNMIRDLDHEDVSPGMAALVRFLSLCVNLKHLRFELITHANHSQDWLPRLRDVCSNRGFHEEVYIWALRNSLDGLPIQEMWPDANWVDITDSALGFAADNPMPPNCCGGIYATLRLFQALLIV